MRDVAPQGDPEAGDVLAAVAGQDPDGSPAALWAALADALAGATETTTTDAAAAPQATDAPDGSDPPESTAEPVASAGGTGSTRSGVAEGLTATTEMIQQFIDEGLLRVVVVELGGIRRPDAATASTESPLRGAVEAIAAKDSGRRHPLPRTGGRRRRIARNGGRAGRRLGHGDSRAGHRCDRTRIRRRPGTPRPVHGDAPGGAPGRRSDRPARQRGQRPQLHDCRAVRRRRTGYERPRHRRDRPGRDRPLRSRSAAVPRRQHAAAVRPRPVGRSGPRPGSAPVPGDGRPSR